MKNKRLLLFLLSLTQILFTPFSFFARNIEKTEAFSQVSSIEDGAVYFIKPYLSSNKCFDVASADYTDGNNVICYDCTGCCNQRFVLEKSYGDTYRIKPLECNLKYCSIANNSDSDNANVVLCSDGNYTSLLKLQTDRFKFEYDSSRNAFKISTAITNYSKYICPNVYSINQNAYLVQRGFLSDYANYFYWVLEKTDTLGANVQNIDDFSPHTSKSFLINQQYSLNYWIDIKSLDSYIFSVCLYTDYPEHNLIYGPNSSYAQIKFLEYFDAYITYIVTITNESNYTNSISYSIYPEKTFVCSPMYDYGGTDKDCCSYYLDAAGYIASSGYYPIIKANVLSTEFLGYGPNRRRLINADVFINDHHGNPGGTCFFDERNDNHHQTDWIDIVNMPWFSGTELTIWNCCESAKVSENHNGSGITSSLAKRAVEKNATYSIGWVDSISVSTAQYWMEFFLLHYFYYEYDVLTSLAITCSYVRNMYINFNNSYDDIFSNMIFYRDQFGRILEVNPFQQYLAMNNQTHLYNEYTDSNVYFDEDFNQYHLYHDDYVKTNIPIEGNNVTKIEKLVGLITKISVNGHQPNYISYNDNEISIYEVILNKNNVYEVFDFKANKFVDFIECVENNKVYFGKDFA